MANRTSQRRRAQADQGGIVLLALGAFAVVVGAVPRRSTAGTGRTCPTSSSSTGGTSGVHVEGFMVAGCHARSEGAGATVGQQSCADSTVGLGIRLHPSQYGLQSR
jgi:hypothetical protein